MGKQSKDQGIPQLRLLIVSVGSLVGQNIIDSLEYEAFRRRQLVYIAGTNSLALSANNFRCDECFLVPPTAAPDYQEAMKQILLKVQPDIILSARDADTAAIWKLMDSDKSLPGKIPYGSLNSILYALDKWQSFLFCQKHKLPIADTFAIGITGDIEAMRKFTEKVGFPMIAKPVEGFASKGVFFVKNWNEALSFVNRDGYLFQEYLGAPDAMDKYFKLLEGPTPLFSETPNISHHTCHIPINAEGQLGEVFVLKNHHNFGAVTRMQRVLHPELENLARVFAEALVAEGGFGPLSVQFRQDKNGQYKAQEMNLRTTGSTFARLMMGQDEIGYIVQDLMPSIDFPIYTKAAPAYDTIVTKSLYSYQVVEGDIEQLIQEKHWKELDA